MNLLLWLQRSLCEPDGTPSSRRLLYLMVIAWSLGLATGLLVKGQSDAVVKITEAAIWATAGAVAVGRFAEKGAPS